MHIEARQLLTFFTSKVWRTL